MPLNFIYRGELEMKFTNIVLTAAILVPGLAFAAPQKWDLTGKLTPQNRPAVEAAVKAAAKGAKVSIDGNTLVVDGANVDKGAVEAAVAKATSGLPSATEHSAPTHGPAPVPLNGAPVQ